MVNRVVKFSGVNFNFFASIGIVVFLGVLILFTYYPWLIIFPLFLIFRIVSGSIREIVITDNTIGVNYFFFRKDTVYTFEQIEKITFDFTIKWGYHSSDKLIIKLPIKKPLIIELSSDRFEHNKVAYLLQNPNWNRKIRIEASDEIKSRIEELARDTGFFEQ